MHRVIIFLNYQKYLVRAKSIFYLKKKKEFILKLFIRNSPRRLWHKSSKESDSAISPLHGMVQAPLKAFRKIFYVSSDSPEMIVGSTQWLISQYHAKNNYA